jgi:thimet oligopeptidase
MSYQNVREDLFHEFGHAIANVFGNHQKWFALNRASEDDFNEVTATLFEHWAWNPSVLAVYARHYQTNEPMPPDLATKMRRAADFSKGMRNAAQLAYAKYAFELHNADPKSIDAAKLLADDFERYAPWQYMEGIHKEAGFTHLANLNYSSGYYAYQFALTIAKDMLATRFNEDNLLDPAAAARLRDTILKRGGSKPAADLVKDFLGRPFNERAWATWLNQ